MSIELLSWTYGLLSFDYLSIVVYYLMSMFTLILLIYLLFICFALGEDAHTKIRTDPFLFSLSNTINM